MEKQQSRGGVISNFTKRETFFISYNNQVLYGVISQYNPLLAPSKKGLHLPISLAKKTEYLSTHLKEKLIDLF